MLSSLSPLPCASSSTPSFHVHHWQLPPARKSPNNIELPLLYNHIGLPPSTGSAVAMVGCCAYKTITPSLPTSSSAKLSTPLPPLSSHGRHQTTLNFPHPLPDSHPTLLPFHLHC